MYTSFKELRNHHACVHGYNKLAHSFIGKQAPVVGYIDIKHEWPISLVYIMNNNDILDATWALRTQNLDEHSIKKIRTFCVECVGMIKHRMSPECVTLYDFLKESHINNTYNSTIFEVNRNYMRNYQVQTSTDYSEFSANTALINLLFLLNPSLSIHLTATHAYDVMQYVVRIDDMYTDAKQFFIKMCK